MRLVGVDAYTDQTPIAGIMQDVLCLRVYDGANMGLRRRWPWPRTGSRPSDQRVLGQENDAAAGTDVTAGADVNAVMV